MGRATRWLKGLLGMKNNSNSNKEKENQYPSKSSPTSVNIDTDDYKREKGRWSFAKSASRDGGDGAAALRQIPVNIPVDRRDTDTAAWYKNYVADGEEEQSKHAIAVAAATAAAADAAVAAAQAAVAVVRLTSRGAVFNGSRERWAAVKIQTVFRGFLSRKALKALKALVKLQAHVRGYLVRKRATATLRGMQALIRVQAAARSQRTRRGDIRLPPEFQPRRSLERFDESRTRSEYPSKRLSATYDHPSPYDACSDNSPKIVEVDTYKPRSASRRSTAPSATYDSCVHDCGYPTMSSPLPCPAPARLSVPDYSRNLHDSDWGFYYDDYRTSSAHSTPRFANSSLRSNGPPTPPRSVCGDGFFRRRSCGSNRGPHYMANTQSFRAKSRSQSAPRQRPGTCPSPKKRISLDEIMASRNSVSCVRMQRCSPHFPQGLNF